MSPYETCTSLLEMKMPMKTLVAVAQSKTA
jgi:hypothetical protein